MTEDDILSNIISESNKANKINVSSDNYRKNNLTG